MIQYLTCFCKHDLNEVHSKVYATAYSKESHMSVSLFYGYCISLQISILVMGDVILKRADDTQITNMILFSITPTEYWI